MPRPNTAMAGYIEAQKIQQRINLLLSIDPPASHNYLEWMRFSRTLKIDLDIIEELCNKARIAAQKEIENG